MSLLQYDPNSKTYTWHGSYEQRLLPKAAGFMWSTPLRLWWTGDAEKASKLAIHADDGCKTRLEALATAVANRIASSQATVASPGFQCPAPQGLSYLPFQQAGIEYSITHQNTLIADSPGLGKTIQALGLVNASPGIHRVLVICPASLRLNWEREAKKWLIGPWQIEVVNGGKAKDFPKNQGLSSKILVVVNYDIVAKHRKLVDAWAGEEGVDLLVLDEAHIVKNPKAQRTKAILGAFSKKEGAVAKGIKTKRRLYLTGTPIMNKPIELWPLLASFDSTKWSFWKFASRYCGAHKGRFGWDFSGASRLEELQEELRKTCMIRRLKSSVMKELPPKRRQVLVVPVEGEALELIKKEIDLLNSKASTDIALESTREKLEQVKAGLSDQTWDSICEEYTNACRIGFEDIARVCHEVAVAKVPNVVAHLLESKNIDSSSKIVVFARHHDVIDGIIEGLTQAGEKVVKIDGRDCMTKRQESVDAFQTDPSVGFFVGQIKAAGVGLTLTASSHVVFAELDWVPANLSQAENRCHRIGTTAESALIQHVVLQGSLDERMAEKITEKQDIADRALDGDKIGVAIPELPQVVDRQDMGITATYDALAKRGDKMTEEEKVAAHNAMKLLASYCDGAVQRDGMGFNKLDARTGLSLARLDYLTNRQAAYAEKLAKKYSRQTGF